MHYYNYSSLIWDAGHQCIPWLTQNAQEYHLNLGNSITSDVEMSKHLGSQQFNKLEAKSQREIINKDGTPTVQDAYNRDNKYEVTVSTES